MLISPALEEFSPIYASGRPQLVATTLVGDLETPVSAYLKLTEGRPFAFLVA